MAWASRLDVADSMDDWMVAATRGLGAISKKKKSLQVYRVG